MFQTKVIYNIMSIEMAGQKNILGLYESQREGAHF